jgi:hypothetical protein
MSTLNQEALDRLMGIGQKACDLQHDPLVKECNLDFEPLVVAVTATLAHFGAYHTFTPDPTRRDDLVLQQGVIALQHRFVELWTSLLLMVGENNLGDIVDERCTPDQADAVSASFNRFKDEAAAHPGWTVRMFVLSDGHEVSSREYLTYKEYLIAQATAADATAGDWYWSLAD